jgi:hypothetical protein
MTLVIPVGVLYVAVILLTARFCSARGIMMVGAGCSPLGLNWQALDRGLV